MAKISKRVVDGLKPSRVGVEGSNTFTWDSELRGFGVRASSTGLKSFIVQYRDPDGRSRRKVIGRYGVMTPEQARQLAREILYDVSRGIDPDLVSEESKSPTVSDICDWYLREAEAGRLLGRSRRPIKSSTLAMDRSRIEAHIKPLLGTARIEELKLGDIESAQADIAAGKTAKARRNVKGGATTGGEGVASRTMSTLHSILEHAVRLGEVESNPARGVRRIASKRRERRLSRGELTQLGKTMRQAEAEGEHPTGLAAIRFLLMTGFRRMEGLSLERTWLREEESAIRFPDTKSGAQTRVIGKAAMELLCRQPKASDSTFFFPADWGDGHFVGVVRVLDRVCARARLEDVSPHILRHTFASVAADLGFSELTIAALLGHSARGVTQRYIHIDEAVRLAADKVAGEIDDILAGRKKVRSNENG